MTLPSVGVPLAFDDLADEFKKTASPIPFNDYYGVAEGIPSSGTIGVFSFYGKMWTIWLDFNSDTYNVNLRTVADTYYTIDKAVTVIAHIKPGVVIGSTSTAAAFRTGTWPAGSVIKIINEGTIIGRGGKGGDSGIHNGGSLRVGDAGANGAGAFLAEFACSVDNLGKLQGGGGGGGGAIAGSNGAPSSGSGCGGGGGGAGRNVGAGGASPTAGGEGGGTMIGKAGTLTAGGKSGYSSQGSPDETYPPGYYAGDGGGPGVNGDVGGRDLGYGGFSFPSSPTTTSGGTRGYAVSGNSFITWINTGTRNGTIS